MVQHLVKATTHAKKAAVSQWCRILGVGRSSLYAADSRHALPVAANVRARQLNPEAPNQAWASDITYVCTRSGWLYLAVVLDLFSRRVAGWSMAPSMPAQLVCAALGMAIASRQPLPGLYEPKRQLLGYSIYDSAVMEHSFLNLKMERVWQRGYANYGEAQADIADYIVGFYNPFRLHSTLGYRSPAQYERQFLANH